MAKYNASLKVSDEARGMVEKYAEAHNLSLSEAADAIVKAYEGPAPAPTAAPTGDGLHVPSDLKSRVMGLKRVKEGGLDEPSALLLAIDWGVRRLNALDGYADPEERKRVNDAKKENLRRARGERKGKGEAAPESSPETEQVDGAGEGTGEIEEAAE